jgi:hypothetical protein
MTEDHETFLCYCYSVSLITINFSSISQSDQSSWMTCGSLSWKLEALDGNLISIQLLWGSANESRRTIVVLSMSNT